MDPAPRLKLSPFRHIFCRSHCQDPPAGEPVQKPLLKRAGRNPAGKPVEGLFKKPFKKHRKKKRALPLLNAAR